ncbi:MAG TPA: CHC2 zinc finger domain-containing protein [Thermoanaerobaculia bacterium]|jgi:DNA primase|nr:CHC2 zinc finger domain-containing protein [Thermoanaerobaculia bacterium]
MRYSREVIDQVREASNLLKLAGELTTLRPIGRRHYGLCPFHEEKKPSFSIDPERGLYFCYGCNQGGDVIAFHRKVRGLSFNQALEDLANRFGIPLPPSPATGSPAADGALEAAAAYYAGRLSSSPEALLYLSQRGISLKTAAAYRLGCAGVGWQDLLTALSSQHSSEELLAGGLVARSPRGALYDRIRNRIVFPLSDAEGRTAGLATRTLDPLRADYRFTSGTPRRRLLFGLEQARLRLQGGPPEATVFVVEGFFDVLAVAQAGVPAVGILSNRLTSEQAVSLARHAHSVTLFLDGDEPGRVGLVACLPHLLAQGLSVRHVLAPAGEDPASLLLRHGCETLSRLESYDTLVEQLGLTQQDSAAHPAENARRMAEALRLLRSIPDPTQRIAYAQHAASHLGLPAEILLRLLVPGST